ncbi:MAG: hypothetical protein Ct9H300mP11_08080 [Chloroflexota bacterium]|nr:MAG: hypothetical protein Ct9H300mP11_08080 [Chloroflexota bacterium]
MLRRLHQEGIYYNDVTFSDPMGRSHILVALNGRCRLIDFGISLNLDQHPNLGREEVHNFVRTLPMYRVFLGMAEDQNHVIGSLMNMLRSWRLLNNRKSHQGTCSLQTGF